jgi:hypothetical protein
MALVWPCKVPIMSTRFLTRALSSNHTQMQIWSKTRENKLVTRRMATFLPDETGSHLA